MDANRQPPQPDVTQPRPADAVYVGIDVSKDTLDVAVGESGKVTTFPNDAAGHADVVALLRPLAPAMVVVESTGGLERALVDALLDADVPVALVHPGRVRKFADALGISAKTDAIDARLLARFGRQAGPRLAERRGRVEVELRALVLCRRQLVQSRAQQANRLGATPGVRAARRALEKVIATLDKQVAALEKQIRGLLDADDDFRHLDGLLRSVPGVGPALSSTIAAELPELGTADGNKVSALVGVAPFNRDSGKDTGTRSIRGGRASVRHCLYMATVAALHCNPVIRALSDRLREKGKAAKVALVACMRKLLTLLNAMARDGLTWDQLDVVKNLAKNP
jgi:transposase